MTVRHPLSFIPPEQRLRLFLVFLLLTLAGFGIFQVLDQPLRNADAPSGIVSFELAGTPEKARAMLDSWDSQARLNNAFGLGFDFVFMPVYAITLGLGVLLASSRRSDLWLKLGAILGWAALTATLFDTIENIALFTILRAGPVSPYPQISYFCAIVKFTFILSGILYGFAGWLGGKHRHL